ncbi:fasciclin domain-containing protein, partial [Saccharicrinis sp. 156]|uniref:fasciclin domain-containing protein n=1 Tax=Saccharicrinis sp. 156 TaxID=3417574 RepID=UPI003D3500C6
MKNYYYFVKRLLVLLLLCPIVISTSGQTKSATQSNIFNFYDDPHYEFLNSLFQSIVDEAPLTVFLPTKDAFEHLTEEQKDFYFQHPFIDLIDLLKGHMVSGVYSSTDLTDGTHLEAINGNPLLISHVDHNIYVNDSKVRRADVHFGRSIIHFIDKVIIPKTTVVDIIVNSEDHNTLEAAVIAAEL